MSILRIAHENNGIRSLRNSNEKYDPSEESKRVEEIEKKLQDQSDFISIAAHELRAPIIPILFNAEILEKELGAEREELRIIIRNAYRLQYLAQNILDVAKIESGVINLERSIFNLTTLISEVLEDHRSFAKSTVQMQFDFQDEIKVNADRNRIAQVLYNILGNAVKVTEKGQIEVTVKRSTQYVIVIVRDSGPGIDPQVYPHLFSKFGKRSGTGAGMGLGLFISRKIIEAHEGTIMAANNPRPLMGANFSFSLPVAH